MATHQQPVINPNQFFVVVNQNQEEQKNNKVNVKAIGVIRAFAIFSIIDGVASIALQTACLAVGIVYGSYDPVGHGIWAGAFYVVAGGLGLGAAARKTKSLVISTLVFSSISIPAAIAASVLSGLSATYGWCYVYSNDCDDWYPMEWSLMGFSIGAAINSIILTIFMSIALCSGKRKSNNQTITPGQLVIPNNSFVMGQQQQATYASPLPSNFVNPYPNNPQLMTLAVPQPYPYSQQVIAPASVQQQKQEIASIPIVQNAKEVGDQLTVHQTVASEVRPSVPVSNNSENTSAAVEPVSKSE